MPEQKKSCAFWKPTVCADASVIYKLKFSPFLVKAYENRLSPLHLLRFFARINLYDYFLFAVQEL